ncbi:UNKNOWN [Stylonychia lemnae]|uniref:Uncharacterized protein n=1 Tax=Stylonychia lemnae TaxID=5949 RepID=A0A078B1X9_STYLE|nr:UNKNOWN [Stylonychia lemnae]|eukprot:CDW88560.1 UNKNOWN [Stylonychia lemnae]
MVIFSEFTRDHYIINIPLQPVNNLCFSLHFRALQAYNLGTTSYFVDLIQKKGRRIKPRKSVPNPQSRARDRIIIDLDPQRRQSDCHIDMAQTARAILQKEDQNGLEKLFRMDELLKALKDRNEYSQPAIVIEKFTTGKDSNSDLDDTSKPNSINISSQDCLIMNTFNDNTKSSVKERIESTPFKKSSFYNNKNELLPQMPINQRSRLQSPKTHRQIEQIRPSPLVLEKIRGQLDKRLPKISTPTISPFTLEFSKKQKWKKISRMIQLAQDDEAIKNNQVYLESSQINSASGTKKFLQRIEDEIGFSKQQFATKPSFMKQNFKPETHKKYREAGGVAMTNRQAEVLQSFHDYEYALV